MANYVIKIDLLKLQGAFVRDLQGKTAAKRCVIIPVDDNDGLFLDEKGCYLNMVAVEMREPRYNDTHFVKADIPRERREAMTEEQLNAVRILGGLHAIGAQQRPSASAPVQDSPIVTPQGEPVDDLPF